MNLNAAENTTNSVSAGVTAPAEAISGLPISSPLVGGNRSLSGRLTVTLHQGAGFSAPDRQEEKDLLDKHQRNVGQVDRPHSSQQSDTPWAWALLDYEHSQVSVRSFSGTTENPKWSGPDRIVKFDVIRAAELAIYVYLQYPEDGEAGTGRRRDVFLGRARLNPFVDRITGPQWLQVEDGTSKICVSVEYSPLDKTSLEMDVSKAGELSGWLSRSGGINLVTMKDTKRQYARKRIRPAELGSLISSSGPEALEIKHAFIAPLTFTCRSAEGMYMHTPFASGGHLFSHVQRAGRFDVDRSRFYAAEIVSALDYLHDTHHISAWLKPENVLLDSLGHITLCGFGLFLSRAMEAESGEQVRRIKKPEYPAPEVLGGESMDEPGAAADWWTLGVFLYEMLTGLPPFYDSDVEAIRRNIMDQQVRPISVPEYLPPSAADITTRLLAYRPDQRLGGKGAAEVKGHALFRDIDWERLLQKGYEPAFKPDFFVCPFKQHGVYDPPDPPRPTHREMFNRHAWKAPLRRREPEGEAETKDTKPSETPGLQAVPVKDGPKSPPAKEEDADDGDDWELLWDPVSLEFQFHNRSTDVKCPVPLREVYPWARPEETAVPPRNIPSQKQKLDALEASLQAGRDNAVLQIVRNYDPVELNTEILLDARRTTPLQWATRQRKLGLVRVFLAAGADANIGDVFCPPALIEAVETGDPALVQALLRAPTSRVILTRALGRAVDRPDTAMVEMLLAATVTTTTAADTTNAGECDGIRCDFEPTDRPHPRHPDDTDQIHHDPSQPEEYMPPLVRAVRLGEPALARLLLAHGADPNIGYHGLDWPRGSGKEIIVAGKRREQIGFSCGRVVQLAMELGHREMVGLLLDGGADIGLPQPVWPVMGHRCEFVPRAIYQKVTAGLRVAAAAATRSRSEGEGEGEGEGEAAL